jgi:peptide/nickel transport system substrate-binding protein
MPTGEPDESVGGLIEGILRSDQQPSAPPPGHVAELLTFLFADIRGYTSFTQRRGDEAAAKLTGKFATIVRELVVQFGGTVFELRGDEAMCIFASPRQSLRLAVALQQRFVEETVADADLPMTIGIGVDAGEAVRSDDGYRGGALNLAARLCSQAKAGEVLASGEVTHLARALEGIRYVVQDPVRLKGIADPVRPVRVLPEGEDPAQQLAALMAASAPPVSPSSGVSWLPGPLASRSRGELAVIAVAVVVVLVVVIAVLNRSRGTNLRALAEDTVGVVDSGNGHVVSDVSVGGGPSAAAAGFGSVWTADTRANAVSRIDTSTHDVSTINVGAAPSAIATGLGSVWVANSSSGTVSRIDPTEPNQPQTIAVGTTPGGITVADGSVWVTNTGDGTVARIDPSEEKVVQTIAVGNGPSGIAADASDIWVADSSSNTVSKISVSAHGEALPNVETISVGNDPTGIAVSGGGVWVTNNLDGNVARIATGGTSVTDTVRVGGEPGQVVVVDGRVWVASRAGESVAEIDPASSPRLIRTVPLHVIPGGLVAVGRKLWVTATIDPALHHGGTIRIVGQDTGDVDPAYPGAPWTTWLLDGTYDGLVSYRKTAGADGSAIVPDLATSIPDSTNGGRTYTFQLRSGIRWSNGAPLTTLDVRLGLERSIASGATPFTSEIVGTSGCSPAHCDVSGIAVDSGAGTVAITLVQPNVDFLDDLAAYGFAAPVGTPLGVQESKPIPATGPYEISRYIPGKLVLLTRNPYFKQWSDAAQPAGFPDRIEWDIADGGDTAGVAAVAAGTADWADARGTDAFSALQARFGNRLFSTPTETTHGVFLNTRVAPFDEPAVRRALAYAVDRQQVADDWFTNATVTCQTLPPDYPAHRPYCPFTSRPDATGSYNGPDVLTAQRLIAHSPTRGMSVTVWAPPNQAPGMQDVVTALQELGYRASLHIDKGNDYFGDVANSRNKVQAGFFGWVAGDENPEQFFDPQFRCGGFTAASANNANAPEFCSAAVDRLMDRAEKLQSSSPAAADQLWTDVDRQITDAAPWIPLVTPSWVDVVSKQAHNYQRNPVLGVLFDQMWVSSEALGRQ